MKQLNSFLKGRYGKSLDGRPRFRLVWSADQHERRLGTFNDFHGEIFIRQVREVRKVKKYHWLNPPCWVLEYLEEGECLALDIKSGYEPLFAFQENDGSNIRPEQQFLEAIIWGSRNPTRKPIVSQEDLDKKDESKVDEIMGEEPLGGLLKYGDAISFGGIKPYEQLHSSKPVSK